jgi:hypothetical protein
MLCRPSRPHRRAPKLGACVLTAVLGQAAIAARADAVDDDRGRPWGRRTTLVSPGFGLGLGSYATQLEFAFGARYFVLNGLAVGLTLSDSVLIFKDSIKASYPGINKLIPTNIFRIVPTMQYVFYRSRWFSPYVEAGVGPAFFNNKRGTYGYWVAGPGAYIGIGGPVFLNIGVDFFGSFPISGCNDAFSATVRGSSGANQVSFEGMCSFGWRPKIGIVIALGRSSKRRARSAPPGNPLPETIEPLPREQPAPPPPREEPVAPPVEPVPAEPIEPPPGEPPFELPPIEPLPPADTTAPPPPAQPPVAVPN